MHVVRLKRVRTPWFAVSFINDSVIYVVIHNKTFMIVRICPPNYGCAGVCVSNNLDDFRWVWCSYIKYKTTILRQERSTKGRKS